MGEKSKLLGNREREPGSLFGIVSAATTSSWLFTNPPSPWLLSYNKSMHYLLMACPAGVCSTSYPSLLKTSITVLLPMKWPAVKKKMTSELKEQRGRERTATKSFLITGPVLHPGQAVLYHSLRARTRNTGSATSDYCTFPRSFQLPHSAILNCRCDWNVSHPAGCCTVRPLWISWYNKGLSCERPGQEPQSAYDWDGAK